MDIPFLLNNGNPKQISYNGSYEPTYIGLNSYGKEISKRLDDSESVDPPQPSTIFVDVVKPNQTRNGKQEGPIKKKHFKLLAEPNEQQRKSYWNENRCLLPKPLTICPCETNLPVVSKGIVHVKLVREDLSDLESTKANILRGDNNEVLNNQQSAEFTLKVSDTSDGSKFRLAFTINYQLEETPNVDYEDFVISRPFVVSSNKKEYSTKTAEKDRVFRITPNRGPNDKLTCVRIEGKNMQGCKDLTVLFGETPSPSIQSYGENFIVCNVPPMVSAATEVIVPVHINFENERGENVSIHSKKLFYRYEVETKKRRKNELIIIGEIVNCNIF